MYQVLRADEGQSVVWEVTSVRQNTTCFAGQPLTYLTSPRRLVGCLLHCLSAVSEGGSSGRGENPWPLMGLTHLSMVGFATGQTIRKGNA